MMLPEAFQNIAGCLLIQAASNPDDSLKTWGTIVAILVGGVGLVTTLVTKTYPWARAKIESRKVSHSMGATLFTPGNIERTIRYYVPPYTQSLDPAGGEESRRIHDVQSPLFKTLDHVLRPDSEDRYHILLADSGMGKTSALINYYVRHLRRWHKKFDIAIVPLGIPDADERIKAIQNRSNTVLFLDALDEDTLAMVDHRERLRLLLNATSDFQRLIITCRTQFFARDEEIPEGTGIIKVGSRGGNESAEQVFYKIYLTPFTDEQIRKYLIKRYPIWRWKRRRRAFELVKKIPHLTARPMLLSRIDDLVDADREVKYSFQLYEEMVAGWIRREKGFVNESEQLRTFSERLAVNLYMNRGKRGAERVTRDEIESLAKEWGINIFPGSLSGRGLLNRDADGNFKFAHRSIMEYLFVKHAIISEQNCFGMEWTDQMKQFLWEMIQQGIADCKGVPSFVQTMSAKPDRSKAATELLNEITSGWGITTIHIFPFINEEEEDKSFIMLCIYLLSLRIQAYCFISIHVVPRPKGITSDLGKADWISATSIYSWSWNNKENISLERKSKTAIEFPNSIYFEDSSGNLITSINIKHEDKENLERFLFFDELQPYLKDIKGIRIYLPIWLRRMSYMNVITIYIEGDVSRFSSSDLYWLLKMFRIPI